MSEDIGSLLTSVREATSAMVDARGDADEKARVAIEAVERELLKALDGESLRGLADLGDGVHGLRVGVEGSANAKLPKTGRAVPVLEAKGLLVVATMFDTGRAFIQRAPRGVIRASLLLPYMRVVELALGLHVRSADMRSAEFRRVSALADRVVAIMR